jgi:hypothetical protein
MATTIHPRALRATVTAIRELQAECAYFTYEDIAAQAGYDPRTISLAMRVLCGGKSPIVTKERIEIKRAGAYWRYHVDDQRYAAADYLRGQYAA